MAMTASQMIRRYRQTKIVATLGPASSDAGVIENLFKTGVDVFRLNFSHGTHDDHRKVLETIRKLEKDLNRMACVIADLQGPKLRIGNFQSGGITLTKGQTIRFDSDESLGDETRVHLPHPEVMEALDKGTEILLDDGKVRIVITKKEKNFLEGTVEAGEKLSDHKGFNIPGMVLPIEALTEKDYRDLDAALEMGVDWVAQSFVQKPGDVMTARKYIDGRAALMIKLEKPSAIAQLDEMVELADGVMIARGDLGVEMPAEDVPAIQKKVIRHVRAAGKPVIVATQMLESMIDHPRPTRAEASDVATAVYDGADAVMLSAETAAGKYPVEAVAIMDRICQSVEQDEQYHEVLDSYHPDTQSDASDAITVAAYYVAQDTAASAIVNYTTSGSTTLRTARQRPDIPILCLTQNLSTARRLMLSYGVRARHITDVESFKETVDKALVLVKEHGYAQKGDQIVLTAGVPFGTPGSTNVLRIARVE